MLNFNNLQRFYVKHCTCKPQSCSDADINIIQEKFELLIPSDFRSFYTTFNGGVFCVPSFHYGQDKLLKDRLEILYGITDEYSYLSLEASLNISIASFGRDILPVGYTIMGNFIFALQGLNDCYEIVTKHAFRDDYYHLADSLTAFFSIFDDH